MSGRTKIEMSDDVRQALRDIEVFADVLYPQDAEQPILAPTVAHALHEWLVEINNASDWWYWDGIEPLTFGCLAGGTIAYQATEVDYEVSLDDCAFSDGLSLTGDGVIHGDGSFTLEVETDGGNALSYARDAEGERSATGTLDP